MYSPSPKVMDLLLDAICVVDAEGRFVYISAACERILGYSPAELIGRPMMELIHPDDLEATLRTAQDVMRGRQKNHFENRYIRKDGQIAHIMWSASWSEEEQLRVAVAHDISQRKHADAMQAGVYAISVAANRSEELTELFAEIHRIIAGLLPIGLFSLALRSDQEDNLNIPYFADLEHPQAPEVGEQTKALSRAIIERGQPILLTTETLDEEQLELLPLANRGAMNWLGVPLISPQGTFGALVIHGHSSSPRYTVKDRELLHFVSSQIAAAIQRLQLQSRLKHLSHHDQLTGLPNRTLLYDRLERSLARARRE
ncbi:MAG: PAS domain S-box protein, partial [Pseudomonas sp.]